MSLGNDESDLKHKLRQSKRREGKAVAMRINTQAIEKMNHTVTLERDYRKERQMH
jgi:hypothetical protein